MSEPKTYSETIQVDSSAVGLDATQDMLARHIAVECAVLARRCINAIEKENIDRTGYHIWSFKITHKWDESNLLLQSEMVLKEELPHLEPFA
jgi:hypothetical protein